MTEQHDTASDSHIPSSERDDYNETFRHDDETLIIASVLAQPAWLDKARSLTTHDFSTPLYQSVWRAMINLISEGTDITPLGILTVDPTINSEDINIISSRPLHDYPAFFQAVTNIASVRRKAQSVELLKKTIRIIEEPKTAEERDWRGQISVMQKRLAALSANTETRDVKTIFATISQQLKNGRTSIKTGIARLDEFLGGGLNAGNYLAISSQAKTGRTLLMATISYNLDKAGIRHLVILTKGTTKEEFMMLKLARGLNTTIDKLHEVPPEDIQIAISSYPSEQSYVLDQRHPTPQTVQTEIMYQRRFNKIECVIIDGFQKLSGKDPREPQEQFWTRATDTFTTALEKAKIPGIITLRRNTYADFELKAEYPASEAIAELCLTRDQESPDAYFETKQSSLRAEHDIGSIQSPILHLNHEIGPHFESI